MNNDLFAGMLGLCRKAGKISVGHDESKLSVKNKKAFLCILSSDSSKRLQKEFETFCSQSGTALVTVEYTMEQFLYIIGSKAAVITVNDENLSKKLMTYREVNI